MTQQLFKTKGKRTALGLVCLLFFIKSTTAQPPRPNIDSLKALAQAAPFPARIGHLIGWYQETNENFHEPEIAMMKAGVGWLEAQPNLSPKLKLNWSNLQLMLASMYADNERLEDLFRASTKVVVMADSVGNGDEKWMVQKGQAYFYLSKVAYLEGKAEVHLQHLEKALATFEGIGHKPLMAQALGSISVAHSDLGDHQKAFDTAGRSAQIYQSEGIEQGYLRSRFYQAVELVLMKKLEEAEVLLNELIPRLRETAHTSLNIALVNLGDVQAQLGRYEAAQANLTDALEMAKQRRVNATVADTYQFLANMEEKRGDYEKALFYQREQARYADSIRTQSMEQGLKDAQAKFELTESEQKIKELEQKVEAEQRGHLLRTGGLALVLLAAGGGLFWFFYQKKKKEVAAAARSLTIHLQPSEAEAAAKGDPFMDEFLAIVQEQMGDEELSVEGIAQRMKMSRVQLFNKVKSAANASPSEIIRQYRLEAGRKQLLDGKLTISEVAYRVGFGNPNSFSRAFKERFGVSPTVFLGKNGKGN